MLATSPYRFSTLNISARFTQMCVHFDLLAFSCHHLRISRDGKCRTSLFLNTHILWNIQILHSSSIEWNVNFKEVDSRGTWSMRFWLNVFLYQFLYWIFEEIVQLSQLSSGKKILRLFSFLALHNNGRFLNFLLIKVWKKNRLKNYLLLNVNELHRSHF